MCTVVKRVCPNCGKTNRSKENSGYVLNNKLYFTNISCNRCSYDISVEDRNILDKAKEKNVVITKFFS